MSSSLFGKHINHASFLYEIRKGNTVNQGDENINFLSYNIFESMNPMNNTVFINKFDCNRYLSKRNNFSWNFTKKMEMLIEKEEELRKKIKIIQQKEKDIDEREYRANQILSEQIEDLRTEEILLAECEQKNNIFLSENSYEILTIQSESLFNDENNEDLLYTIKIENDNQKKKTYLNSCKSKIEMLKKSIKNHNKINTNNDYRKSLNLKLNKNCMDNHNISCQGGNELEKKFIEKKLNLENIQNDIFEKEKKVLQYRNEMELKFKEKISMIEALAQRILQFKNNIKVYQCKNQQNKIKISNLQQEKGVIKREIDKTFRYLKILSDRNYTIKKKIQIIEKKKKNIEEKARELSKRRHNLNKCKSLVLLKEKESNELEEKVISLEKKVTELENQNNAIFKQMKMEQESKLLIVQNNINKKEYDDLIKSNLIRSAQFS